MRQIGVIIATRHTDPREAAALARHAPGGRGAPLAAVLADAQCVRGRAAADGRGSRRRGRTFQGGAAPHRARAPSAQHADLPVPTAQQFVFSRAPGQPAAASLAGLAAMLEQLPPAALDHHLRHHDFSRWLADVFRDEALARAVREVEHGCSGRVIPTPPAPSSAPSASGMIRRIAAAMTALDHVPGLAIALRSPAPWSASSGSGRATPTVRRRASPAFAPSRCSACSAASPAA